MNLLQNYSPSHAGAWEGDTSGSLPTWERGKESEIFNLLAKDNPSHAGAWEGETSRSCSKRERGNENSTACFISIPPRSVISNPCPRQRSASEDVGWFHFSFATREFK